MKSKFVELVGESYKVIKNFMSPDECDSYAAEFREDCDDDYDSTNICGVAKGLHQHEPAMLLLVNKNKELSEHLGEDLLPTYSYTRSYGPKAYLDPHIDRPACQVSVTVHLDADKSWDFEIVSVDGKKSVITLEKGDAIMFDGINFTHNRIGDYTGEEYTQLFLHYVFADGSSTGEVFDYSNTRSQYITREDYISYFPKWLSPSECDGIVNATKDLPGWIVAKTVDEVVPGETNQRVCETFYTGPHKEVDQLLFTYVSKIIGFYNSSHRHIDLSVDEGYNLLRYRPGGKYEQHTDQGPKNNRAVTIIFNLNDDYEGGELSFFSYDKTYHLAKGDVIVFPSSFMFDHGIRPVTSGIRYSMVTWAV